MILPIYAYGTKVLKKKTLEIQEDHKALSVLIDNMWETMYNANGVGLAAPQIGQSIRIFIVDTIQMCEEGEEGGIKKVFINPRKISEEGAPWDYEEGCLSIPEVRGDVERLEKITLAYLDTDFMEHIETFDAIEARVIQHEYDHLEAILFIEMLKPVKKRRVKRKLENIRNGNTDVDYPMRFI